ncbi:MAG TPA: class I SAM-dependent methyltransferase [Candidatus Omnitrophota bacterium]|nr:class I SAM-dependent methyltransferase [Candidatus Omnitrophota bacterium]
MTSLNTKKISVPTNIAECLQYPQMDAITSFPVEDGIIKAYIPNNGDAETLTSQVKQFYEKTPFPNYDEMDNLGSLIEKSRERQFPEMLNQSIPPNAKVLEVGCGTGQLGNFLSIAGRTVFSVDMCWNSLRLAQTFKEKNNLQTVSFAQMNLFRMPLKPESFDVVICTGVLHHTGSAYEGFRGLLPLVKPGGHIIIGLYNRYGRMQTKIRSAFFKVFGEKFAYIDPYLRQHGVMNAKKSAWFQDQYCHPHETCHTMDEVLGWFKKNQIEFIRSFPSCVFGDSFSLDYHNSVFSPQPSGSRTDRLFSQLQQMFTDTEGGLFIMIGKKP